MIYLRRPPDNEINRLLSQQRRQSFSYEDVGATRDESLPTRHAIDHNRVKLGKGHETFERAREALRNWQQFNLAWLDLCWPATPIQRGNVVAVVTRALGIWTVNVSRIVYVIDEETRFGFAYGTLPHHVEAGEERFLVECNRDDGTVWYDILAFSRPGHLLVAIGYPIARRLQRRFAHDSLRAMQHAVTST